MSFEAKHLAEALQQMFTTSDHGWFSSFVAAMDGLTAQQAAAVPAEKFNSVWGVVNHVRFWQEAALLQLQKLPVDHEALGAANGWPSAGKSEAEWEASKKQVVEANAKLAAYVAGLSEAGLNEALNDSGQWNTRHHLIQSMIAHNSYHACELISIRNMQGLFFDSL
ncbi:MAG: DinB family protein [Chloroflexi bacterium]|nr:DinB family protein [Chloroflexota bacterium]